MWPFSSSRNNKSRPNINLNPFQQGSDGDDDALNLEQKSSQSNYAALMFDEATGQVYARRSLRPEQIVRNYTSIAPLYTAVSRIANAVASLPLTLVNTETNEAEPNHPAFKKLCNPNPYGQKTRFEFIRDAITWKLLTGNTYYLTTGLTSRPPIELYLLNPSSVLTEARNDASGSPDTITYNPSQAPTPSGNANSLNNQRTALTQPLTFTKRKATDPQFYDQTNTRSLYHVHTFNPDYGSGDFEGVSELSSLFYEVSHWMQASQHNIALLANGARPSGAFVLKAKDGQPAMLSQEQFDRLQSQIKKNYQGSGNAGRPLILEGGLEWSEMQMTPKDLDFDTLKNRAEEGIYKVMGIPIQLIMADSVTANNLSNFRLEFYENRILPLADELCHHINRFFLSRYPSPEKYEFQVNRDEIDVLIPRRVERRDAIERSLIMTLDEKRKIFKLPNIKYGNKVVDPNGRPIAGEDVDVNDMPSIGAPNPAPSKDTPSETVGNPEGADT